MNETITPPVLANRSCGDCAMCCKIPIIRELNKPAGQWCTHCSTRSKCDIYLDRPQVCHDFYCAYMRQADIGEHWHPATSRMVISYGTGGNHLFVLVDQSRPDAWRRAPYLQDMKKWARINNPLAQQIFVSVGARSIVIFPDREVDLGVIGEDETVHFERVETPNGMVTNVRKSKTIPSD